MPRKVKLVNGKVTYEELAPTEDELTFEARFKRALKETRHRGVKVRQNVRECCRSCVTHEKLGVDAEYKTPFVWTYGGQGSAYRWLEGRPYYYGSTRGWYGPTEAQVDRIYFNHGGEPGTFSAQVLEEEMLREGIKVDWNGEQHQCVVVITPFGEEQLAKELAEKAVQQG